MDVSSVASPLISIGTTQGTPNFGGAITPASNSSSQSNNTYTIQSLNNSSTPQTTTAQTNTPAPSANQITKAVKQMNDTFDQRSQNLYATIGVDKTTGIEVVKIVDSGSNETIVQYPSKEAIAAAEALQRPQGAGGQLINTNA